MAIERCDHAKTLVQVISQMFALSEDDVEAMILNDAAHDFYAAMGLSSATNYRAVAEAVRATTRSSNVIERVKNGR